MSIRKKRKKTKRSKKAISSQEIKPSSMEKIFKLIGKFVTSYLWSGF